jgi:hypothetical protein
MAFATSDDVGTRLGRTLTAGEALSVDAALEGATAEIAEAAHKDSADISPVPDYLRYLCVEVACRMLANPNSLDSLNEQLGQFNYSARFRRDGGGMLLTDQEVLRVRRVVHGRNSGSVRVASIVDTGEVEA